ncbi:hypothetical protein [Natrinema sp. J7-2]|uniref:hypothetical protein n=1 Tax=Natrinema sp. (strain J7-2) TaxID=406552 RepID=UPI00067790ED|nr:hypothetical protein [Natrinema sp. J7-2]
MTVFSRPSHDRFIAHTEIDIDQWQLLANGRGLLESSVDRTLRGGVRTLEALDPEAEMGEDEPTRRRTTAESIRDRVHGWTTTRSGDS